MTVTVKDSMFPAEGPDDRTKGPRRSRSAKGEENRRMAEGNVEERVRKVVCRLLKVPPEKVTPRAHFIRDLGMESIQSVELIAALEEEFGCEIDEDEVADNDTFEKAVKYMEKKMAR